VLLPFYQEGILEAGCDEAGRGCLAGPVVAAVVILPPGYDDPMLDDSKRLTKRKRVYVKNRIIESAVDYGIGMIDNKKIDEINILNASFKAMHLALNQLTSVEPDLLLIDGNRFIPYKSIRHVCIVKGDSKYMSIAAASVLAKTYRDELMLEYSENFPQYGWHKNVGYPTHSHREAIRTYGITPLHRKSFRLLDQQYQLFDVDEKK
jgi:ribonuclease HII